MRIKECCQFLALIFLTILFLNYNTYSEDLRNINNRADYIIITSSNNTETAEALAKFRKIHNSFATMVVSIDSIKTQFSETNQITSPDTCLRNFIQYTLLSWAEPKPKYFLLAGNVNSIPSHMELESVIFTDIAHYDSLMIDQWFIEGTDENGKKKLLAKDEKVAGKYSVHFNGNNLASGIYFYKLQTETFSQTKKLMLMK